MATATSEKQVSTKVYAPSSAPVKSSPALHSTDDAAAEQAGSVASRNLLVILHGKRVDDDLLREALQEAKHQGHQLSVRVTFDRGDVEHFVNEAVRLNDARVTNYNTIVAGGGDGTLNEVVSALMQHREAVRRQGLSVGLIPLGTANDFACSTGISVDPHEALRVALDASLIRPIDVALVNGRPFLNVAVAGELAEVPADELSSKWKRLLGPLAIGFYVAKRLSSKQVLQPHASTTISFAPHPAEPQRQPPQAITTADSCSTDTDNSTTAAQQQQHLEFQTDLLMLVAGNSRQMGRTLAVCPDALLDDGLLDFTLLSGSSLATQAAALLSALASRDDSDSAHDSGICQLRASRLEVVAAGASSGGVTTSSSSSNDNASGSTAVTDNKGSSDKSRDAGATGSAGDVIPVNRDGEPEAASSRLVFEVLHRVLPFHLPDERLLLSGQASKPSSALSTPHAGSVPASSFITGSIKHPDKDAFIPARSAVPSPPAHAAGPDTPGGSSKKECSRGGQAHRRRHHRHRGAHLTVRTLRRMLVVAGPEGQGVRRRAALTAAGRKLCMALSVVVLGSLLGWAAAAKAAKGRRQQEEEEEAEAAGQQQPRLQQQGKKKSMARLSSLL